jgi:uncharacterized membrane protein
MKKAVLFLLLLVLVAAFCLVEVSFAKASYNEQTLNAGSESLPSPLIIGALIVASVALFGAILSLYLKWRDNKKIKEIKKTSRLFSALP